MSVSHGIDSTKEGFGVASASCLVLFGVTTEVTLISSHSQFTESHEWIRTDTVSTGNGHRSEDIISKSVDKAMDKANPSTTKGAPGISIRYGPMDEMDVDGHEVNGHASTKRKARTSTDQAKSYKEASDESDEDEAPLVCEFNSKTRSKIWR